MESRVKGFVQSYNRDGGYGFILPLGGTTPVFVEEEDIEGDPQVLSEEQQVTFTIELGLGRMAARHVKP
ncbi:cold shock domain-containing protein [Streptomyces sp. cmx-4-9]|uniref:cold shock domain-containing protein n=1 Tax=Streptomyces sp. cmx-4-9 TaxID=2790941 RepID=UPI0039819020